MSLLFSIVFYSACSQEIKLPPLVCKAFPRFQPCMNKKEIKKLISLPGTEKEIFEQCRKDIEEYVVRHQADSTWIVSRLMMFWKSKSTNIFIKGGIYDHAEGNAPVPTVRFPGQRGGISDYVAPKLEDILPYMDDPRGLYLRRKSTGELEWVDIAKTGTIIEGINNNIMRMAYTAAVLYWLSDEEKYAKFAFDLFDTYMTGMYYRKEPYDLSHGHHQTIAGLSSFEVIQEVAILNSLTGIYDFLHGYLQQKAAGKMKVYNDVFRKWADIQIDHGVAFNNWNLLQAKNVLNIALVLEEDDAYADKKGNHYYTNYILNTSSQRQWSLQKVINEGYDKETGLWNESAGYSLNVLNDVTGFVDFFDRYYDLDLVQYLPVLKKSVTAAAQYLFPNGFFTSFGDSHYGRISTEAAYRMVANARKNKKPDQEHYFSAYIKALQNFYREREEHVGKEETTISHNINDLLVRKENVELNPSIAAADIKEYVTPVFSSPHVSLFNLRSGLDPVGGFMVSMSGSKGNHMHAGGVAMELYGKGYVLAPESGIGTNYFQPDYAEYYSQFPAHNTVAVDGISSYPVMKSNHGFKVNSSYPKPGVSTGHFRSVSFGNLYFLEPESQSDQLRLISLISTGDSTGYYIDIFRSRRRDGMDKMHDYFYHNIGQQLIIKDNNENELPLRPTNALSFGGGHLFAYDYFYDKKSVTTNKDINAIFKLSIPGKDQINMNMWMKGEEGREIFSVKAPKSTAIDRMDLPKEIVDLPMPTLVARQTGEAWDKPFVAVFEPTRGNDNRSITRISSLNPVGAPSDFTGLKIDNRSGSSQYIFSCSDTLYTISYKGKLFAGTFGVINVLNDETRYLFMGNGRQVGNSGYSLTTTISSTAVLELKYDEWYYASSAPCRISFPIGVFEKKLQKRIIAGEKSFNGRSQMENGHQVIIFELPALPYGKIELK